MISISAAVTLIVYLLIVGMVFGLLLFLINYTAREFPTVAPFAGAARVILMILAVLVLIGILLSLVGSAPIFRP